MKILLALTCFFTLALSSAQSTELGDFLWMGKYYRQATASEYKGVITIESPKDGSVKIPVANAPATLKKKLGLPDAKPAPAPSPADAANFQILGATEPALVARYGAATSGGEPEKPATKALAFRLPEFKILVQMLDGRCGKVSFTKESAAISPVELDQLLKRAGGQWNGTRGNYTKSDGSAAVGTDKLLWAATGDFRKAQAKVVQEKDKIKGL